MPTIHRRYGVVASRPGPAGPEYLLITARTNPGTWIFPLGTPDPGETAEQTAARECAEESGCTVAIGEPLAVVDINKPGGAIHRVVFFAATHTGELPNWETDRQRRWVPATEMLNLIAPVFLPAAKAALNHHAHD